MITDNDLEKELDPLVWDRGHVRTPLVWVIDEECVYDNGINHQYVDMFKNHDQVIDVSSEYPNNEGITVRFLKNGIKIEDLNTSEYFGSILLSNPTVVDQRDYPYGYWVISPRAKFDGEKFIILDSLGQERNNVLFPWHQSHPNHPDHASWVWPVDHPLHQSK
jgi:hypothetical protein